MTMATARMDVSTHFLVKLLRGDLNPLQIVDSPIPSDAKIVGVQMGFDTIWLTLQSDTYEGPDTEQAPAIAIATRAKFRINDPGPHWPLDGRSPDFEQHPEHEIAVIDNATGERIRDVVALNESLKLLLVYKRGEDGDLVVGYDEFETDVISRDFHVTEVARSNESIEV